MQMIREDVTVYKEYDNIIHPCRPNFLKLTPLSAARQLQQQAL